MKSIKLLALVVASFMAASCGSRSPTSPSSADVSGPRTVVVSLSGSDSNTGTQDSPWKTIRYGVSQLRPGDTLYIRGGVYAGADQVIDSLNATVPGGTSSSPITIAGFPGEQVTIQPPNGVQGLRLSSPSHAYLTFENFTLDYSQNYTNQEGIYLSGGANHNRFRRLEVRYVKNFGVVFSRNNGNSNFNEVIDCDIHHMGDGSGDKTRGHGVYVSTSDNVFRGNKIHDNEGYGLHFYDDAGPLLVSRNVIQDNHIYANGYTNGRPSGTAYGVAVAWGDGNRIAGNNITANVGGILVFTQASNTEISGNTIYDNTPYEGIMIARNATSTVIRNNSISLNGGSGQNVIDLGEGTTIIP